LEVILIGISEQQFIRVPRPWGTAFFV